MGLRARAAVGGVVDDDVDFELINGLKAGHRSPLSEAYCGGVERWR
jgi:hypothetical protein